MDALHALVLSLPTRSATLRTRVWRALRDAGCGVLRDGVYVLPAQAAGSARLAELESGIRAVGGFAMTVELRPRSAEQSAHVRKLFDRSADYGALVQQINAAKGSPRQGLAAVQRLQRSFDWLSQIDFFPGQARSQAADALDGLKRHVAESRDRGEPRSSGKQPRRADAARYRGLTWATRKEPWVDRLASAWLIKRFIDREAKFVWLASPRARPRRAVGFDFDGAEFTHTGNRVTFEVLVSSFGLDADPALTAIGAAVHFLDVGGIPVADAKGLETMMRGAKEKTRSDDALLGEAMRVLDLFYSAYKPGAGT
jgi:hypothetical protein